MNISRRLKLIETPVLALLNFSKSFKVTTNSATQGTAFFISQFDEHGLERMIAYGGTALKDYQNNYTITELEFLGIIFTFKSIVCVRPGERKMTSSLPAR